MADMGSVAQNTKSHGVTLTARTDAVVTGVLEVISFDETLVLLKTAAGDMVLEGIGLRVHTLDVEGGRLAVTGEISGLYYQNGRENEKRPRRGLFR